MEKDRLLAFSDGVLAIIITIMAPELRPPPVLYAAAAFRDQRIAQGFFNSWRLFGSCAIEGLSGRYRNPKVS